MKEAHPPYKDITNSETFTKAVELLNYEIATAQVKVMAAANAQLLLHYWKMGLYILEIQKKSGWGAKVISKLSDAIRKSNPNKKGYSTRNLTYMCQFAKLYPLNIIQLLSAREAEMSIPDTKAILQTAKEIEEIEFAQEVPAQIGTSTSITQEVPAQIEEIFLKSPIARTNWASHQVLMDSKLSLGIRFWYMLGCPNFGWSSNILDLQIKSGLFQRQILAKKHTNFQRTLPKPQSDLANYLLKDPYIFDITESQKAMDERDIENQLVTHVTNYLLEMGNGFSFVARQKHFEIGGEDFFADLILYNIKLHAYVVIELKARKFKPGDAAQLNFYMNVVNDKLKGEGDNDTIGIVLCQGKSEIMADYVLKGYNQPNGISDYQMSKAIPEELKSTLPTIEDIERELSELQTDKKITSSKEEK